MPSNVMHYYFSNYVKKALSPELLALINRCPRAYNVGAQGPDILFYLRTEKPPLSTLGVDIHDNYVAEQMFELSAEYAVKRDSDVIKAFLLGQLTHYALDANLHPYIIKKSSDIAKNYKENQREYIHVVFESALDYLCVRHFIKKNSWLYRSNMNVNLKKNKREDIGRYYSELTAPFMDRDLPLAKAKRLIGLMKLFLWVTDDVTGLKYIFLRIVERAMRMPKCLSSFIRPVRERKNEDWLNHSRAPYPVFHEESLMTDKTVEERMEDACTDAAALMQNFYLRLTEGQPLDGELYQRNYSGQRREI